MLLIILGSTQDNMQYETRQAAEFREAMQTDFQFQTNVPDFPMDRTVWEDVVVDKPSNPTSNLLHEDIENWSPLKRFYSQMLEEDQHRDCSGQVLDLHSSKS